MGTLVSILAFIAMIGLIILVHEAGHFLVGKLTGVRVLRFALGFGPAIPGLRFKRGETEYRINAIPLGGYVKFHGDEPGQELAPEERRGAFNHAAIWRRTLIVLAGPVANFILPLIIFFIVFVGRSEMEPAVVGAVVPGGPAAMGGLQPGDEIVAANDAQVRSFWELQRAIDGTGGQPIPVEVRRGDRTVHTTVVPEDVETVDIPELNLRRRQSRMQLSLDYALPVVSVVPGGPAARAGLRDWDRVLSVDGQPIERSDELFGALVSQADDEVRLLVLSEKPIGHAGGVRLGALGDAREVRLPVAPYEGHPAGLRPAVTLVHGVQFDSPASRELGLFPGDVVLALDGLAFPLWSYVQDYVTQRPDARIRVRFQVDPRHPMRQGLALLRGAFGPLMDLVRPAEVDGLTEPTVVERDFQLERHALRDTMNIERVHYVFGAENRCAVGRPAPIPNPHRLKFAVLHTFEAAGDMFVQTAVILGRLFTGGVSLKALGGPLMIGQMAGQAAEQGAEDFFRLTALLSINIGLINLLPIPVLDGGHLLLFAIEAVRRKPLSLRARTIVSYIGLAFIALLIVIVFKNDIERMWGDIARTFGCEGGV